MARQLGRAPAGLIGPEFPDVLEHLWAAFTELHSGRHYTERGGSPLTYEGIKAWSDLTGIQLSPFDLRVIKALDAEWIGVMVGDGGK